MALKPCKECGQEVSTKAPQCPNCGVKDPGKSLGQRNVGCGGCLLVFIGIVFIGMMLGDPAPRTSGPSSAPTRTTSPTQAPLHHAPQAVNVREGRGTDHPVAYTLNPGDRVYVSTRGVVDNWAPVFTGPAARDTAGYVRRDLLRRGAPPDFLVLNTTTERGRFGSVYITGEVLNTTSSRKGYVQIQFNLLRDGAVVGSTMTNMNNLGPGESWRFQALWTEDSATHYRLEGVTGY